MLATYVSLYFELVRSIPMLLLNLLHILGKVNE